MSLPPDRDDPLSAGLSDDVFRGKGSDAQWGMDMEVQIRATDHPLLHSSTTPPNPLYISVKVSVRNLCASHLQLPSTSRPYLIAPIV